jgi:hypothetical protein
MGLSTAQGCNTGDLVGTRSDIVMVMQLAITIVHVSVEHAPSVHTLSAAAGTVG